MDQPRNVRIDDLELNWAKLDKPVSPFGTAQYELQIVFPEARKAEMEANHLTTKPVKDRAGFLAVSLKRKAFKADGTDNGPVRVVDANKVEMTDTRGIGNGSIGNVILFQYPYSNSGRSGIATSLTAVQITSLEAYTGSNSVDFDVVGGTEAAKATEAQGAELF